MAPDQMAHQVLRLGRQRGLTFRLDSDATGQPVVRVSPKDRLAQSPWLQQAIPRCKAALVHLLQTEGMATLTTPAGQPGYVPLARCATCGASDYGPLTTTTDAHGALEVWGCLTCLADPAQLQRAIEAGLADARWGGQHAPASHLAEQEEVHAAL